MKILKNISLRPYNTFHIDVKAKEFSTFISSDELNELTNAKLKTPSPQLLILGGGSNILFTKDFDGLILKNEMRGMEVVREDADHVYIKVGAGENWHRFVLHCLDRELAGVENLSLIPGNVGASPMQNIGAYGVEIKEVFEALDAFHLRDKKVVTFTANDCRFGYRESIFKGKYKDQFAILHVIFRLNKRPGYNINYGALEQELERMAVKDLSIRAISQAVINIRTSKLPDPDVIGNSGSFFKNPQIPVKHFTKIKEKYPGIPSYPVDDRSLKVPAGWLIEQSGPKESVSWKGYRRGDAGCHQKQALVLVNYGNASGKEIFALSEEILLSVKQKFGIELEREVNVV